MSAEEVCIKVCIGNKSRDNRTGDFLNAIDEVVSYFQKNSEESLGTLASLLRICADRLENE